MKNISQIFTSPLKVSSKVSKAAKTSEASRVLKTSKTTKALEVLKVSNSSNSPKPFPGFFKKSLVFLVLILSVSVSVSFINNTPASADARMDGTACTTFLGMTNWDCGFTSNINSEAVLTDNIIKIAMNILADVTVIAAYLVVGYVIYGGYLYMFSSGDAGKVAAGKKTLTQAFIGLAIVMSAYTIFAAIRIALIGNQSLGDCDPLTGCVDADTMVINLIQWVAGIGGVVAAAFIIVGGWGYMTSAGDPGKLQKAKNTLLYALIGLTVVAAAEVITAFVANIIRDANAYIDINKDEVISRELTLESDLSFPSSSNCYLANINIKELS